MLGQKFERFSGKEKHEGFFSGLYSRNEIFLIVSAVLFLSSMFIGYFLSGIIDQFMGDILRSFTENVREGKIKLETVSIFLNNLRIALFVYIGVGIFTAFFLIFNGLFIGYAASKFPVGDFIIYTLPHGIFEIAGIIIAGAAGFRLASTILRIIGDITHIRGYLPLKKQLIQIMNINYEELKESLTLFAIAVVLILIGAIIEANFTITWGSYIKSMI